jgi:hypothetical protein
MGLGKTADRRSETMMPNRMVLIGLGAGRRASVGETMKSTAGLTHQR